MKTRIFSAISFVALSAAAVFACSNSNSGGTAGACQSYANAYVAYQERCTGTIDPSRQSDIAARFTQLCEGALALPGVKDISGQLSTCASNLSGASCNESLNQVTGCDIEGTGTLADGTACVSGAECQSGDCLISSSGTVNSDGGATTCGTCAPALADGADCSKGGTCVQGDICKFMSSDGGFSAICTKKPAPGGIGAACSASTDCAAPNHCDFSGSTTGSETGACAAPIPAGGTCVQSNDECADGLVCSGQTTRTCTSPVADGAACTGGDCTVGSVCDFSTTKCVKIQFAAPGAACDDNTVRCSQGTCVQQAQPGGGSGGGTGTLSGTCPTIIADGQACTSSGTGGTSQCDEFASCTDGKCAFVPTACK